ncbi:MAG: hypothetical protein ACOCXJ_04695 [Planctomycetota bacterium]
MLALIRLTWWQALRHPTSLLVAGLAAVALLLSWTFGAFNFEDQDRLRLLATSGVAVSRLSALFLAALLASTIVHDELSGRTAHTLFAKPLGRTDYLFGRSLGIWLAIGCLVALLAAAHAGLLAATASMGFPGMPQGRLLPELWLPWQRLLQAHALVWAESATLTALATVLALRLPLITNLLLLVTLFVGINLAAAADIHALGILPSLGLFGIDDSLQFVEAHVPATYFALSLTYAALYACGLLLMGAAWFQRQDIP